MVIFLLLLQSLFICNLLAQEVEVQANGAQKTDSNIAIKPYLEFEVEHSFDFDQVIFMSKTN